VGEVKTRPRRRKLSQTIVVPVNRMFSLEYVERHLLEVEPYRSFEATLKEKDFHLHFSFIAEDEMQETIQSLIGSARNCDGLLLLGEICTEKTADLLRTSEFPHVSFDANTERFAVNTVLAHSSAGIARAAEHLHALGHRRIGFLGRRNHPRYALVVAALTAMRLSVNDSLSCWLDAAPVGLTPEEWRKAAREAVGRSLDGTRAATALICSNDEAALGAVEAVRERGLKAGEALSLVGHDNIEVRGRSPVEHPILTTIDNPTDRIGRRMAQLLLNQILYGQREVVHERLPAPLIVRESTQPLVNSNSFLEDTR
jgi:LacI family transcriptional regulator